MSLKIAALAAQSTKKFTRAQLLKLVKAPVYDDGRTKQSFADETNIEKIMARADRAGTISHLQKFEGVYADFSDFDFFEQTQMLTKGREIFDELPAEIRTEFQQSPAKFFDFVNHPDNKGDLRKKLPALAAPGRQIIQTSAPEADEPEPEMAPEAAVAATSTEPT